MGISVEMFCKSYKANSKAKEDVLRDFLNKHVTTKYISFVQKCSYCDAIVKATTHIQSDIVKVDSAARYLLFVMHLINIYTDIDIIFDDGKFAEQYDMLSEAGALQAILSSIPQQEYAEFDTILKMKMDDFYTNEYSIESMLYNFKKSLDISTEQISKALEEVLEKNNTQSD